MPIELTEQQHQALQAESEQPLRVIDPQTGEVYVLVSLADFETARELLEDERQQRAIHAMALRNAGRIAESEP